MTRFHYQIVFGLSVLGALAASAPAQQQQAGTIHIGYVYPAGGRQGTSFDVAIGGQFMNGLTNIYVSGGGVQATLTNLVRPISGKELNELRIQLDELMARRAVVRNDFKALEAFRSFKNAKNLKADSTTDDKEIEQLKKKYANATWTSADDKLLMEIRHKIGSGVRRPANPAISEIATFRVTLAPDAKPGEHELRVATPFGLSNPLVFEVSQLPEYSLPATKNIAERTTKEPTRLPDSATHKTEMQTTVTLPAVLNGQVLPGGINRHRFTAQKGQKLVIAVHARKLIPYLADAVPGWFQATLALYDANGKELAYDDDFRFDPDPVLYYEIPTDGEYTIEIKDSIFRGREDFVYRITVGELPFITSIFPLGGPAGAQTTVALKGWNLPASTLTLDDQKMAPGVYPITIRKDQHVSNVAPFAVDTLPEIFEQEPNNQAATAQPVTLPVIINGRVDQPGDVDVFRFDGKAGNQIVAEVYARRLNSPLDSVLRLTDAAGKQIAFNDDHEDKGSGLNTHHADSYLTATLPADGTYYLYLADTQHQGGPEFGYRLRISAPRPNFELRTVPSSLNVRLGTSAPITVYALRRDGFAGEIAVALKNAPPGFKLSGGNIPAQKDQIRLTLSAPPTPLKEPLDLAIEGRATIDGREIVRAAVPAEDMMQAFEYRHLVASQELKVDVVGRFSAKGSLKVLSPMPIKIPAGGIARIQVNAPTSTFAGKIQLELSGAPEGISIKTVAPLGFGSEIVVQCDAEKIKPGQKGNLIVSAFAQRKSDKNNTTAQRPRFPIGTLPAIPFEVVER